jgi:SAM-dependent methyltransferase
MSENIPNCEVCSGTNFVPLWEKDELFYQKCNDCGLIRLYPQTSDERLAHIYQNIYKEIWTTDENLFRKLKTKLYRKIFSQFKVSDLNRLKLLDIGAAKGTLMDTAQEMGMIAYGCEVGEESVRVLKNKFGEDRIFDGYFDQIDFVPKNVYDSFDIITMFDLIEHIRNPGRTLEQAHKLLKINGKIICYLPDSSSMMAKVCRKRWEFFCPEHLYSFSKSNIKQLFQRHGFQVECVKATPKYLTVKYARHLLGHHLKGGIAQFIRPLLFLIPKPFDSICLPYYIGQMTVIASKNHHSYTAPPPYFNTKINANNHSNNFRKNKQVNIQQAA